MSDIGRSAGPAGGVRAIALLAASALFMESLDGTIIAIALPDIARTFAVAPVDMNVGMTSYLIALSIFIPLSSWLADRQGAKLVFGSAVGLFTLASLLCAASVNLQMFIVSRALQGAAAAMMTPVGRLVVLRQTDKADLMNSIALLTWPALLAPAIAPPLGGLIVAHYSWHWIFLINVPIGIAGLIAAMRLLPGRERGMAPDAGFDWMGLLLWAATITIVTCLVEGAARVPLVWLLTLLAGGALSGIAALRHFRSKRHPLLDITTMRIRSFGAVVLEGSLLRMAILANPFLLPLYFQVGMGFDAPTSGLLILIGMAGNIGVKFISSPLLRFFGFRRILVGNGVILGISFAALALVDASSGFAAIAALLAFSGMARSLQFTALNTLAFADVPSEQLGAANGLLSTVMQVNGAMGVAVGALALQLGGLALGVDSEAIGAFHFAFALIASLCFIAAASCLRLKGSVGQAVIPIRRARIPT